MADLYRVILVDDEYWVLEGLLRIFPWQEHGFEVVGSFMDAEEAFNYMKENPVDLVVSDIRMPEFTGLDLLAASRERGDEAEFVMISGYAEFEYVRVALRNGATDYCLKPIKAKDAEDVLVRVGRKLSEKRGERDRELIERAHERGGVEAVFGIYGVPLVGTHLLCAACRCGVDGVLGRILGEDAQRVLLRHGGRQVLLLNGAEDALGITREHIRADPPSDNGCIGLSRVVPMSAGGHVAVREADMAACGWFVAPNQRVYAFSDAPSAQLAELRKSFELAIHNNDSALARRVIMRAPVLFQREGIGIFHVQQLWNFIAMTVLDHERSGMADAMALRNYDDLISDFASMQEMCQYIAEVVAPPEGTIAVEQSTDSFDRLYEYVREHYCEKLSIRELTQKFYLNPTYCCELFKSRTGRTFSEFVTCLRMERAGEMMRNEEGTLQTIAQEVGYFDYFYFSKSFKKYFGVSPTHYMKGM